MFCLHCTKKLIDRIKPELDSQGVSTTRLGSWYATALFWKPQVALLVNERTLLPVIMPLAPAATLSTRFPEQLQRVLVAHGIEQSFIEHELSQMQDVQYVKTTNRSIVGIMNQFSYLAEGYREYLERNDLLALSVDLAHTPCSPLSKGPISPDRALWELVHAGALQ